MDIKLNLWDIQMRLKALELLLISRSDTNEENLKIFRKEAEENDFKAQQEFRQNQWNKIKLGDNISYQISPDGDISLRLDVISLSSEPFRFLAGKITMVTGKCGYRKGEIFTTTYPNNITVQIGSSIELIKTPEKTPYFNTGDESGS